MTALKPKPRKRKPSPLLVRCKNCNRVSGASSAKDAARIHRAHLSTCTGRRA